LENKYDGWYTYLTDDDDDAWLKSRSDSWLQKLYILLADAIRKGDCNEWILKYCSIIRVLEGGVETHVTADKAYFPKGPLYQDLPQVKRAILRGWNQQATQKIQESLVELGVSEIGDEEKIDLLLMTYYGDESVEVSIQQHLQHMITFIKWWKKEKDASKFEDYAIFRSAWNQNYHRPGGCFLDSPLRKTGLQVIYSKDIPGIEGKSKLWSGYRKLSAYEFYGFAVACGVDDQLSIEHRSCLSHPQWSEMREGLWGARETHTGKNSDYYIPELADLLNCRKREISLLVWDTVRKADPKVFCAEYCPNQRYETRVRKSSLVLQLSEAEWIPDNRGRLHRPCDITREKLHPDFKYDNRNGWLDEIGLWLITFPHSQKKNARRNPKSCKLTSNVKRPRESVPCAFRKREFLTTQLYQELSQHLAGLSLVTAEEAGVLPETPHAVEIEHRKISPLQSRTNANQELVSLSLYAGSGRVKMTKFEWPLLNGTAVGARFAGRHLHSEVENHTLKGCTLCLTRPLNGSTELAMFSASVPGIARCSSLGPRKSMKISFSK